MKICTKCKVEKSLSEFYNKKSGKEGKASYCKKCNNKLCKAKYEKNKDKIKQNAKGWASKNKEKVRQYKSIHNSTVRKQKRRDEARLKKEREYQHLIKHGKKCTKCGESKPLCDFQKSNTKIGVGSRCIDCVKIFAAEYRQNNSVKVREINKKYSANNKNKIRKYRREREQNNPFARIKQRLRTRMYKAFIGQGWEKTDASKKLLGCSFETLKQHMESQFTEGMTWDNYGEWHVDHMIPFAVATEPFELEILSYYKNLQPLWAIDNIRKGDSWE